MTPVAAAETPAPFGVRGDTGSTHPPLTVEEVLRASGATPDSDQITERSRENRTLAVAGNVGDPGDLEETGWGVIFASDADPRIKEQLQPLLDLRRKQVRNPKFFKVFDGTTGVRSGQSAAQWLSERDVALAPVDPRRGVPYYLLIVGSLDRIPFEFQALLDLQWAIGRLEFDDIEDYGRYARKVVEYEDPAFQPLQRRSTAAWLTRNPLDIATAMLSSAIVQDFRDDDPLGQQRGYNFDCFFGDQATKQQLTDILRGAIPGGAPAFLFTGSHGAEWPNADEAFQRRFQGSLVTQAWSAGKLLDNTNQFSGDDLPADHRLHGMIAFLFACYGGGCPAEDNYFYDKQGGKIPVAPKPFIAHLPKKMLSNGTLAAIGHVDRAFSYTFESTEGTPQCQVLRTPIERLLRGERVGHAADTLNLQWSTTAAQIGMALGNRPGEAAKPSAYLANLYIARDDARNYLVLGDPAVRLRVKDLQ